MHFLQDHMRHLHQHWTTLVTSSLPFMGSSLTLIVTSVINQLCCNIEYLASYYVNDESLLTSKPRGATAVDCCLPADYTVTHLEALTFLLHYCLLDTSQQIGFSLNQPLSGPIQTGIPGANPGQIFNNLIHVFMPSPLVSVSFNIKRRNEFNDFQCYAYRRILEKIKMVSMKHISTLEELLLVIYQE